MGPDVKVPPNLPNASSLPKKKRDCASFCHGQSLHWPKHRLFTHAYACIAKHTMEIFGSPPIRNAKGWSLPQVIADMDLNLRQCSAKLSRTPSSRNPIRFWRSFVGDQKFLRAPAQMWRVFAGSMSKSSSSVQS